MSNAPKFPYYPWYPTDFAMDPAVVQMTDMEELMYRRLLDYQWLAGRIATDLLFLSKAARLPLRVVRKCWPVVSIQFPEGQNRRMERERALAQGRSDASASAAKVRWDNRRNADAMRAHMPPQCQPEPEPEPEASTTPAGLSERIAREAPAFTDDFAAAFRSSHSPDSLRRDILALENGMHGPSGKAVPLPIIGQALRDIAQRGLTPTMKVLRGFCERLMRPDILPFKKAAGDDTRLTPLPRL